MAEVKDGSFSTLRVYGGGEIGFKLVKGKLFSVKVQVFRGERTLYFGAEYQDAKVSITDCDTGVCIKTYDCTLDKDSSLDSSIQAFISDSELIRNFVYFSYSEDYKHYKKAYLGMLTARTELMDMHVVSDNEGRFISNV